MEGRVLGSIVLVFALGGCGRIAYDPLALGDLDAGDLDAGDLDAGTLDAGTHDGGDADAAAFDAGAAEDGGLSPVPVDLSLGAFSGCAIGSDGSLWCWGDNSAGQLGIGTSGVGTEADLPRHVGTATDWVTVSSGDHHVCAVRTGGTLWCWGDNMDGQIGFGDGRARSEPEQVVGGGTWTAVFGAISGDHTCAMRDDATLWCMGQNDFGQLGVGDNSPRSVPTQVPGTWRAVTAAHRSTCGIRSDGTLWCWGRNVNGELGIGTSGSGTERNTPQPVGAWNDWTRLFSGDSHTCGVRAGELYCWGLNNRGQLGLGDETPSSVPLRVGADADWVDGAGGYAHTCAIRSDSTLHCWGGNGSDQLGLGTMADENTPTPVGTDTGWTLVHCGDDFTCGVRAGTLYCAGDNALGQLAQGDRSPRTTFSAVPFPAP